MFWVILKFSLQNYQKQIEKIFTLYYIMHCNILDISILQTHNSMLPVSKRIRHVLHLVTKDSRLDELHGSLNICNHVIVTKTLASTIDFCWWHTLRLTLSITYASSRKLKRRLWMKRFQHPNIIREQYRERERERERGREKEREGERAGREQLLKNLDEMSHRHM